MSKRICLQIYACTRQDTPRNEYAHGGIYTVEIQFVIVILTWRCNFNLTLMLLFPLPEAGTKTETDHVLTTHDYNNCVEQHADGVYRFILHNIRDKELARDIVQDSFEKMWINAEQIKAEKSKSWLFTTAYHTMLERIRRSKKQGSWEEVQEHRLGNESGSYTGLRQVLRKALKLLPEIQRTVVLLRDYEGYSYEEIGEITGLNASQVKVYIYRARTTLKEYIGKPENVI